MRKPLGTLRVVVVLAVLSVPIVIIFALEGHAEIYMAVDIARLDCCEEGSVASQVVPRKALLQNEDVIDSISLTV